MKKWHLVIDVEKCENCNNCFLSCKDEYVDNNWPGYSAPQMTRGQKWISIYGKERGQYPFIDVAYLPVPCQHCDDAPCIKAAENNAIYKRPDGIVIIDPEKAKGQTKLIKACPYGAISWNEEQKLSQKCTMCAHLLDEGWTRTRCVQSCPTGALSMLHVEDAELPEIVKSQKLEVYKTVYKTAPIVYYKNLSRFTHAFIGGSVVVTIDGKEDCTEGAKVTLLDAAGSKISETTTDNYGDFKFDGLKENSGKYTVQITYKNYAAKIVDVNLKTSSYISVIKVS